MPRLGGFAQAKVPEKGFNYCSIEDVSTNLEKEFDVYLVFKFKFENGSARNMYIVFNYEKDEAGLVVLNKDIKRLNGILNLFNYRGGIDADGKFINPEEQEIPKEMIPAELTQAVVSHLEKCGEEYPFIGYVYTRQKEANIYYELWKYVYPRYQEDKFKTHITDMITKGFLKLNQSQPVQPATTFSGSGMRI